MKNLISETTREERKKIVHDAIAVGSLDCPPPTPRLMGFFQDYIDGKMELAEIQRTVIGFYSK